MFDSLMNQARSLLGSADPQQVADATRNHVAEADTGTLAQHLTDGAGNLDSGGLGSLAQSLLGALAQHGHDESQVQAAGIDTTAAQNGDQSSVLALIEHARENPAALKDGVVSFAQQNPQLLAHFPGIVQGLLSRLGG